MGACIEMIECADIRACKPLLVCAWNLLFEALAFSDLYWDCNCLNRYIHSNEVEYCEVCGAHRDEQPASVIEEVESFRAGVDYPRSY